jgi:hypothetical protein
MAIKDINDLTRPLSDLVGEQGEKAARRKKQLAEVRATRAAGMTADEAKAAAERGDFGEVGQGKERMDFLATPLVTPTDFNLAYNEPGALDYADRFDFNKKTKKPTFVDRAFRGVLSALNPIKKGKLLMNLAMNSPDFAKNIIKKSDNVSVGGGKTSAQDFKKLVETKRPGGTIFEIGEEGTEGTFKYRGETYSKADGILIGYPSKRAGRDFEKNWVPKKVIEEPNVEAMKEGAKRGLEGKRLKNINEYYPNLQKEMIDGGLTIDEAVVKLAGRDLPRSTKNYQIIGKFYNLADEMKEINPNLYKFFNNEIKAYQIGNFTGRKIKHGTKEYEAARKELAKKLNIDVKDIDRAHSMMAPRLAKLSKLIDEGVLTVEEAKRLSKPQYFLLNADNLKHVQLENKLDTLLQRKKSLLDEKDFPSVNKTQEAIEKVTKEMEELGVKSELFDPIKKLIKVFGREPTPVEMKKKLINKSEGGMASIFDMTGPLDA